MRIRRGVILAAVLAGAAWFAGDMRRAAAQDSDVLLPEQSAAKAQQLIQQAITALGGPAYLNLRDATCTEEVSNFEHSGEISGYGKFIDFSIPPDKDRNENLPKRNIIYVYNGDKGWTLDRGGVGEMPAPDLAKFQGDVENDIDNILRRRIHEPGMVFRYAGQDLVDGWPVDWVELVDSQDRTYRIALSQSSHLPVRKTVETRDPDTRQKTEEVDYYSNYQTIGGLVIPLQFRRDRNGMKAVQAFLRKDEGLNEPCEFNTGLAESLFTKESLEERWGKIGKKDREKEKKKKEKDAAAGE